MKAFFKLAYSLSLLLILLLLRLPLANAQNPEHDLPATVSTWYLPLELNDGNTSISFEVDSTWHLIHGKTSGIRGNIWLELPTDPQSIRGNISIPVDRFDTDNSSRDSRLRKVMNSEQFSNVTFSINSVENLCLPQTLLANGQCSGSARGLLSIENHEEVIPLTFSVSHSPTGFTIVGTADFSWRMFPIEDPSILVARLDDNVKITFTVNLRATAEKQDGLP